MQMLTAEDNINVSSPEVEQGSGFRILPPLSDRHPHFMPGWKILLICVPFDRITVLEAEYAYP